MDEGSAPAVVVVHPLAGYADLAALEFAADPGRTCVALSRHRTHATVILDEATPALLHQAIAISPSGTLQVQQTVIPALRTARPAA